MLEILLTVHSSLRWVCTGMLSKKDGEKGAKANTLRLIWDETDFL